MKRSLFLLIGLVSLSWLTLGIRDVDKRVTMQITPTQKLSTPTLPPPSTQVNPTPIYLTYDQALSTYQEIASEVIRTADRVLDIIKWVIAGIFSLLGISGGAILYISRSASQARDSAARSATAAEESKRQTSDLEASIRDTLVKIQSAQDDIEKVRKHIDLLQQDLFRSSHRLTALADVDSYALRLYSSNGTISQTAKYALIELSKDNDPVVRYKCLLAFGHIVKHSDTFRSILDEPIISCIKDLAIKDSERMIQIEASSILNQIGKTHETKSDSN